MHTASVDRSNFLEWTTSEVCKFLTAHISRKSLDLAKLISKHQLTGLDLADLNEKNLIDLGVQTIHD